MTNVKPRLNRVRLGLQRLVSEDTDILLEREGFQLGEEKDLAVRVIDVKRVAEEPPELLAQKISLMAESRDERMID